MWIKALAFLLLFFAGSGCTYTMPPQKIPMDRRNYIDAVSTSWKEQLLSNLVKLRYGDTLTFLELSSITTGYELGGSVSADFSRTWNNPFWHSLSVGGNVNYIDRPTITYAPLKGDALVKVLMTPIPVGSVLKSLQTGWRPDFIIPCLVESINGQRNRSPGGTTPGDPEFFKIAQLLSDLSLNGVIRIAVEEVKQGKDVETTETPENDAQKKKSHKKEKIKPKNQGEKEPGNKGEAKYKWKPKERVVRDKKEFGEKITISLAVDKKRAMLLDSRPDVAAKPSTGLQRIIPLLSKEKLEKVPSNNDKKETYINKLIKLYSLLWPGIKELKPEEIPEFKKYEIIDGNKKLVQWEEKPHKIVVQTRSVMEVLTMLSNFIIVPTKHTENRAHDSNLCKEQGRCQPLNANDYNKDKYEIKEGDKLIFQVENGVRLPADCFVAVKYGDYWFYIENTDVISKEIFSWTGFFFSMAEPATKEAPPVLTLPVQ